VRRVGLIGLVTGPALALLTYILLSPGAGGNAGELDQSGRVTAAVAVWMATWWLTEAIPLAATALLPLVLFPLAGALPIRDAAAPYASPLIFLFLGGFIIGLAIQRFGLHRRIALRLLLLVGTSPRRLVGGFMLASALLSMWISNTATAIMMLPIGASVLSMLKEESAAAGGPAICTPGEMAAFATALALGIAYACSIGGMGTLVGTPPNLVLAAFLDRHYGIDISMARWLGVGLPLVALLLPLTWWYLTRIALRVPATPLPCGREVIAAELARLGPMERGERTALVVFLLTALAWILRPQLAAWTGLAGLDDTVIAMLGALSLFVIPVDSPPRTFAMDWATAAKVPWEVLLLFGGGLSLAAAIGANGVDAYIGAGFSALGGAPTVLLVVLVIATVVFLTEVTSNTAVTTTLLPVLAATAQATGTPPGMLLTGAALAASCAFMLPVATPPNAIVFASGYVRAADMARVGLGLNLMAIVVVTASVYLGNRLVLT
jgi:sodium-dependent dicarboxylate transporter 2/3/5